MKHAVRAFYAICDALDIKPYPWGEANGFNSGRMHAFLSGKTRPTAELLHALATAWPDRAHGHQIIAAHLLDEIELSCLDPQDFLIEPQFSERPLDIAESLKILEAAIGKDKSLVEPLVELAKLLRDGPLFQRADLLVAEDKAPYTRPTAEQIRRHKREIQGDSSPTPWPDSPETEDTDQASSDK